jgi:hypothetical protein
MNGSAQKSSRNITHADRFIPSFLPATNIVKKSQPGFLLERTSTWLLRTMLQGRSSVTSLDSILIPETRASKSATISRRIHGAKVTEKLLCLQFCHYLFTNYDFNKIYATTREFNKPSVAILEYCNFHLDGRNRVHYWIDDKKYDQLAFSLLREEWLQQNLLLDMAERT